MCPSLPTRHLVGIVEVPLRRCRRTDLITCTLSLKSAPCVTVTDRRRSIRSHWNVRIAKMYDDSGKNSTHHLRDCWHSAKVFQSECREALLTDQRDRGNMEYFRQLLRIPHSSKRIVAKPARSWLAFALDKFWNNMFS